MSSNWRWVPALLVAAAASFAQGNPRGTVQGQARAQIDEEVKQFNAVSQYCSAIESLRRTGEPIRFFSSEGRWYKGTPSKSDVADSVASVWLRDGRVVAATIASEAAAQAGIEGTNYCFREDGTLARVTVLPPVRSSRRAGLHTVVTVGRGATYMPNGQRSRMLPIWDMSFDPHVLKSERTTFRYVEPPAVYKSVDELPFIRLIARQI